MLARESATVGGRCPVTTLFRRRPIPLPRTHTMPDEHDRRPAFGGITESRHLSKFIWGAAVLLLVATVIIPRVDFSLQVDSPRADATPDPFGDDIEELDRLVRTDQLADADPQTAIRLAPMIKARGLTEAGPMTVTDIRWTVEILEDYQPQLAAQPNAAARATLRDHRNQLITDELVRLDAQEAVAVLDAIRQQYIDTFGVDPAITAEPSD